MGTWVVGGGGGVEMVVVNKSLKPNNRCAVCRVEIFEDIWRYLEIFGWVGGGRWWLFISLLNLIIGVQCRAE